MKKIISLFAAVSALALVSCVKEEVAPNTENTFSVNFIAQTPDTKTIFGTPDGTTVPTLWENGDNIAVICNFANDKKAAITTEDGKSASFSAEFITIKEAESYTFYAAYPYVTSPYKSGKVKVNIPTVQAPVDGNIAKDAMGLVAKSEAFTAKPTEPVTLSFKHVAAYGCITKLVGVPETATISAIKITSDNNIVGTFLSDCESTTLTEDAASKSLTINTTAHENIWFSIAPFEGGNVKFEVITDDGTYVVDKDFTGKKFEAGKIAKFGVKDFKKSGSEDVVYTLVKSVDDLVEGANVIIAANPNVDAGKVDYALGPQSSNGNNRSAKNITRNAEGNIINPSSEIAIITLEKGIADNTLAFKVGENYLYNASNLSTSNLREQSNKDEKASWTISIDSEGLATIASGGTVARNTIKYNYNAASNFLFNCYDLTTTVNNSALPSIYIDKSSVLESLGELTVDAVKVGTNSIRVDWLDVDHATDYIVTCGDQPERTFGPNVMTTTFTDLPDGDYVVTVTAKAEGYRPSTATSESIHIGLASRELKFADNEKTIAPGENYTNTLTGNKVDDVVYTITNKDGSAVSEDAITIDENSGYVLAGDVEGEYIVTATAPATAEFAADEASYTLIVKDVSTIPVLLYTLDTSLADNKGKNTSYSSSGEVTCNNITWNATGNISINPWRIGVGKSDTITKVDRAIYTKTPYSKELTKIDLTIGTTSNLTINSAKLVYSSNADFSNATEVVFTPVANGTVSISPTSGNFEANCYYKFVFNVTGTGTSAKYFQFKKVEFYGFE